MDKLIRRSVFIAGILIATGSLFFLAFRNYPALYGFLGGGLLSIGIFVFLGKVVKKIADTEQKGNPYPLLFLKIIVSSCIICILLYLRVSIVPLFVGISVIIPALIISSIFEFRI